MRKEEKRKGKRKKEHDAMCRLEKMGKLWESI